jgi:hypothetical protein
MIFPAILKPNQVIVDGRSLWTLDIEKNMATIEYENGMMRKQELNDSIPVEVRRLKELIILTKLN